MVRKLCAKVKVFQMKVKGPGQGHVMKIHGTIRKVIRKSHAKYESPMSNGLVIRNTHAKYESPISEGKKL